MNKSGAHILVFDDEIEIVRARMQYPEQFLRNLQNLQKAFLLTGIYTDMQVGKSVGLNFLHYELSIF